jgi:hypothetical protein
MAKVVVRLILAHLIRGELNRTVYVLARDSDGSIYLKRTR